MQKYKVNKFPIDQTKELEFTQNDEWTKFIFDEIQKELTDETFSKDSKNTLNIKLSIQRKEVRPYEEVVLVEGNCEVNFTANCIRCLDDAPQITKTHFNVCFLREHFEKKEEYSEISHLFIDDKEYEIYFQQNAHVDLVDLIVEQIFINIDPLPLHDPNCKGMCQTCGENLNTGSCSHNVQSLQ